MKALSPLSRILSIAACIVLLVMLGALLYSRTLYSHILLERDEGEYAYAGQLILNGLKPYQEAYNMKFPGTYAMYALIMSIAGQSVEAIRWGAFIALIITALFVFLTIKLISGNRIAALAGVVVFFSLNSTMAGEGLMSNAEHFVNLFAAAGVYFLFAFDVHKQTRQLVLAGFLSGCAVVMKQHGYVFVLFGLLFLGLQWLRGFSPLKFKRILIYGLASSVPLLLLLVIVTLNGTAQKFFFLTFSYARAYIGMYPASFNEFKIMVIKVIDGSRQVWWIAEASIIALLFFFKRRYALQLLLLCALCTIAIGTGGYYRYHYFILYYAAFAIVTGVVLSYFQQYSRIAAAAAWGACLLFLVLFFANYKSSLFTNDAMAEFREHYHWSPFYVAPAFADTLNALMKPGERLAALSNEPELYFFSKRISATPYIYNYPLFENQPYAEQMLDEYIRQIEEARPNVFVYSNNALDVRNDATFDRFTKWWTNYRKDFEWRSAYCVTGPLTGEYYDGNRVLTDSSRAALSCMEIWVRK